MSWQCVSFTIDQIEEQAILNKLKDQFEKLFMEADGPSDMALLSDNNYDGDKISIYFSPGCEIRCEKLLKQYDATECNSPDIEHVFLLTGNDDALDLLE